MLHDNNSIELLLDDNKYEILFGDLSFTDIDNFTN